MTEAKRVEVKPCICGGDNPLTCPLQMITQQETVTHCLSFILQPIYLHNLSLHTFSQPITLRVYQSDGSPGFLSFQLTKTIT